MRPAFRCISGEDGATREVQRADGLVPSQYPAGLGGGGRRARFRGSTPRRVPGQRPFGRRQSGASSRSPRAPLKSPARWRDDGNPAVLRRHPDAPTRRIPNDNLGHPTRTHQHGPGTRYQTARSSERPQGAALPGSADLSGGARRSRRSRHRAANLVSCCEGRRTRCIGATSDYRRRQPAVAGSRARDR